MQITVTLGGHLRGQSTKGVREELVVLHPGSRVKDLMSHLGLVSKRVCFILVNGCGAGPETTLRDGDRVAFFPPELSFNTFVSISYRRGRSDQD